MISLFSDLLINSMVFLQMSLSKNSKALKRTVLSSKVREPGQISEKYKCVGLERREASNGQFEERVGRTTFGSVIWWDCWSREPTSASRSWIQSEYRGNFCICICFEDCSVFIMIALSSYWSATDFSWKYLRNLNILFGKFALTISFYPANFIIL